MLKIRKASAGAGKTYNLTKRYIMLLLTEEGRLVARGSRNRHNSILAITFTNKATEEMKRRIVHELAVLAGMERGWTKKSPYLAEIKAMTGASEADIQDRAREALRDLLYDFGSFNISTIDSFFQSVLRTFAREAELPGNYEVDLDEDRAVRLGVHEMLQSVNRARTGNPDEQSRALDLESRLMTLMTDRLRDGKGFNLFNDNSQMRKTLVSFMKKISDETYAEHREDTDRYLSDPTRLPRLTQAIRREIERLKEGAMRACADALSCDGLQANPRKAFTAWAATGLEEKKMSATLLSYAVTPEKAFLKSANPTPEALAKVQAASVALAAAGSKAPVLTDMMRHLYLLSLAAEVNKHIADFRAENSTILLSDTNSILRTIIGNDTTPFVYERTGQWLRHFLIDEFQDTSKMQWEILKPLVEESLSHEHGDNLVIGDEKQCIYRFRNSDPTLLHNLHTEFGDEAMLDGTDVESRINRRSAAEVVRFNNTFFRALGAEAPAGSQVSEIYADAMQPVAPDKSGLPGYVMFNPYTAEGGRDEAFSNTLDQIARQIAAGYRPADIAVLFRRNSDGAEFIEQLFRRMQDDPDFPRMKVMSDESLFVGRSRAVRLVISVLRLLDSTDYAATADSMTDRDVASLFHRFEHGLSRGFEAGESLKSAISGDGAEEQELHNEIARLECVTLVMVIERIIARYVSEEQQRAENAYLTALTDMAVERTAAGEGDFPSFLKWWDETGCRRCVPAGEEPDAIRVLTIHKSKGLEWPCVHMPYNDGKSSATEVKWFTPAELDFVEPELVPPLVALTVSSRLEATGFRDAYLKLADDAAVDDANVIYVGFTRAVRELIVGIHANPDGRKPFSNFVANTLMTASAPAFIDSLSDELDADADYQAFLTAQRAEGHEPLSPYISIPFTTEGPIEIGHPTTPEKRDSKPPTLLDPEGTIELPAGKPDFAPKLWAHLQLDEDSSPLPTSQGMEATTDLMLQAMRHIVSAADTGRAVAEMTERGRIAPSEAANLRQLLDERVSGPATARWFTGYKRVMTGRTVAFGGGSSAVVDRMVWTDDGGIDIVMYAREDRDVSSTAGYVKRSMVNSRAYRGVRAYVWDLITGRVTQV